GGVTPVPIPNTEVKPSRADGTSWETARESRSLPDTFCKGPWPRRPGVVRGLRFCTAKLRQLLGFRGGVEFDRAGLSVYSRGGSEPPWLRGPPGPGRAVPARVRR